MYEASQFKVKFPKYTIQRGQDFHAQEVLSHLCIVLDSSFHLRQIGGINVGGSYTKLGHHKSELPMGP